MYLSAEQSNIVPLYRISTTDLSLKQVSGYQAIIRNVVHFTWHFVQTLKPFCANPKTFILIIIIQLRQQTHFGIFHEKAACT
jgi:hypothetical protein